MTRRARVAPTIPTGLAVIALSFVGCAPQLGATCAEDSDCAGDLVCARPPTDGGSEGPGVCAPPATPLRGRCSASADCAAGLFCSSDLPADVRRRSGECIPVQGSGASCFRQANCAPGLECRKLAGAEIGTCEAPDPEPEDAGASG